MKKNRPTDAEILALMDESLANDILTDAYSDEDVAAELKSLGADPEAIGREGAERAAELFEKRRLAWQQKARQKIERAKQIMSSRVDYSGLTRPEMLGRLQKARSNPKLSAPVTQLFHKRKPEDASDEELRELLAEVDALTRLAETSDDKDKK